MSITVRERSWTRKGPHDLMYTRLGGESRSQGQRVSGWVSGAGGGRGMGSQKFGECRAWDDGKVLEGDGGDDSTSVSVTLMHPKVTDNGNFLT